MHFQKHALVLLALLLGAAPSAFAGPPPPWGDVEYVGDGVSLLKGSALS